MLFAQIWETKPKTAPKIIATAVIAVAWVVIGFLRAKPAAIAPTVCEKPQTMAGVCPLV
jgi:uncharacterized membrane protein